MKGAIGNAFIMNMVISFIVIFYMLLIGSMAYSKAYKINKYLNDTLTSVAEKYVQVEGIGSLEADELESIRWESKVHDYLARSGYVLSKYDNTCPQGEDGYEILRNTKVGSYDYCLYVKKYTLYKKKYNGEVVNSDKELTHNRSSYKIVSYMKFDFPILGEVVKIPITSETKTITRFN